MSQVCDATALRTMHEMFKAPTTTRILITTVMALSLAACGSDDNRSENLRQDAASADAMGAIDSGRIADGAQAGHDRAADLLADRSTSVDLPAKADGAQGPDVSSTPYDVRSETGIGLDATVNGDSASVSGDSATKIDAEVAGDASAPPEAQDSAISSRQDGHTIPDVPAKTDLSIIPEGPRIQPNRVLHLAASDFPYQTFVNNWDDATYPVLYALIQTSAEFETYLHPAATMGSPAYAPTEKEFSQYSYVLIARVVDDSPQPATFGVDALIARGTELSVAYQFQNAKVPGTSGKKDGLLIEFPKRSLSKVTLYENQVMLGSLDIANGKKDVTVN